MGNDRGGNNHGGKRPGAGRKPGQGPFQEPTAVVRVPVSQKDAIVKLLASVKQSRTSHAKPSTALRAEPAPPRLPLPLFGYRVAAGFPSPADDHVEDRLDLNQYLVHHKEATFFLRAKGHSMVGAGIHDGDLLVVDRSIDPTHGAIVIAAIDGELTVKRLAIRRGKVFLLAENPEFAPIELKDHQEMVIWGVVTNAIHKLA